MSDMTRNIIVGLAVVVIALSMVAFMLSVTPALTGFLLGLGVSALGVTLFGCPTMKSPGGKEMLPINPSGIKRMFKKNQ
uniref:Wsv386 n=1 Tax=White spot syndrome virus TaxID=92652 RepID=A0A2U9GF59_WSSV|nr:wsv386 [Shrimp white spot syndrome virus]